MNEALDLDNLEWESEDDLAGNEEVDDDDSESITKEPDFELKLDEALKKQTQTNVTNDQERESQIARESKVALDDALQKSRVWKEAQDRKRQAKKERRKALELKINNLKATLLGRIAICININQRTASCLERVLPLVPENVQVALAESQTVQSIQQLISWIRRTFRRGGPSSGDRIRQVDERMLQTNEGSEIAILQILVSVARHFEIPSRLVVRFTQAEVFAEADAWAEFYLLNSVPSSTSVMERRQWYRAYGSVSRILEAEEEERIWEKNRTIDPNRRRTNHASLDASPRRMEDKPTTVCILGFGDGNALKMVTKRYSSRPIRLNPITKYLQQVIDDWNGTNGNCIPEYAREAHSSSAWMIEDDSLDDISPLETSVPTTLEGFRKSSDFVLSSHLKWNESLLKSVKPVNFFKGEAVYRRTDVTRLFNEWGWKKQGRKVRRDELDKPTRILPKKTKIDMSNSFNHDNDGSGSIKVSTEEKSLKGGKKKKKILKKDDEDDDEDEEQQDMVDPRRRLYSEFQTDPIDPGQVDDESGKIPLNEFGNVELFNPSLLPRGGVHLTGVNVEKACQELGVQFACAVVGFEWRDGKTRPKFQGVVVAKKNEELVRQAAEDITIRTKKEEEEAATKLTGADLWRELLVPQTVVPPKSNNNKTPSSSSPTQQSPTKKTRVESAKNSSAITEVKNKMAEKYVEAGLQKLEKRAKVELCDDHLFVNGVCKKCGRKQTDVEYF